MPAMGQTTKPLVRVPRTNVSDTPCIPWTGALSGAGYPVKQYCNQTVGAQRWLWLTLLGPLDEGFNVTAACGDVTCMNLLHLVAKHAIDAQRESHSGLLPADVNDIRMRRHNHTPHEAALLAAKYDVADSTIYRIWKGRTWQKVRARKQRTEAA